MECLNCGKGFEGKRSTAKFCKESCRIAFNRKVTVTDSVTGEVLSVTKKDFSVTGDISVTEIEPSVMAAYYVNGEAPNARSAREYREFQREWIKGSCEKFGGIKLADGLFNAGCEKCKKPYLRHPEVRYVVQYPGLL